MADVLAKLKQRIQEIEGRPAVEQRWLPSGVPAFDDAVGGLPRPGIVEVVGAMGGGRTRLALALGAAAARFGALLWVDPQQVFFPPTASAVGVNLERLVLVRPPSEHVDWTVEQALKSGVFSLVVLDTVEDIPGAAARWTRAAQLGTATLCVISEQPGRDFLPAVRVIVARGQATVQRHRAGRIGVTFPVPAWPEAVDPWR